jgi:uroporphyrinogen decarboxylase
MIPRERVIASIEKKNLDRFPIDMTLCKEPYYILMDYYGLDKSKAPEPDKWGEIFITPELAKALDIDCIYLKGKQVINPSKESRKGKNSSNMQFTDEWGVTRKKINLSDGGYYWEIINHPLKDLSLQQLHDYSWPVQNEDDYCELNKKAKALYEDTDLCIIGRFGGSIFETAWYMRGFEQWMMDLLINQELAVFLLEKISSVQMKIDEICLDRAGKYIQIIKLAGDDLGGQNGLLISAETYRKIVKPVLCNRWKAAKTRFRKLNPSGYIMFHTCGNVYPILNDFIDCELDILDPIQKVPGMEIEKLKKEFCGKLTFHGAVDTQFLLPFGSEEEVAREVQKIISVLGSGGGLIVAPVHNIQSDVPVKNIFAMIEAVKRF